MAGKATKNYKPIVEDVNMKGATKESKIWYSTGSPRCKAAGNAKVVNKGYNKPLS